MDVYVNSDVLSSGKSSVRNIIGDLENATNLMKRKISAAHTRFDSRNYDRICEALNDISDAVRVIEERLEESREFLDDLLDCIEEYDRLKY